MLARCPQARSPASEKAADQSSPAVGQRGQLKFAAGLLRCASCCSVRARDRYGVEYAPLCGSPGLWRGVNLPAVQLGATLWPHRHPANGCGVAAVMGFPWHFRCCFVCSSLAHNFALHRGRVGRHQGREEVRLRCSDPERSGPVWCRLTVCAAPMEPRGGGSADQQGRC